MRQRLVVVGTTLVLGAAAAVALQHAAGADPAAAPVGQVFMVKPVQSSGDENLVDAKDYDSAVPASDYALVPLRKDVAMTGEITLRGKVLPIGVVKEKVLAAHRAGVKNIVLPKDNEKDLADIPKNVLDTLNIYMVQTMDEVLKIALAGPVPALSPEAGAPVESAISDDTITH